jgi:hypothetical protein
MRTNDKVELIACDITQKVLRKFTEAGKQITALLEIKQEVMNLAEDVRSQNGQNILTIIKAELPEFDLKDFEEDFQSIMFFKGIYDKTETYFSNLINKTLRRTHPSSQQDGCKDRPPPKVITRIAITPPTPAKKTTNKKPKRSLKTLNNETNKINRRVKRSDLLDG